MTEKPEYPEPITWADIPEYGDHMPWGQFVELVRDGMFIDYDGYADYATSTQVSDFYVLPSQLEQANFERPSWATHVVWYNK